MKKKVSLILLTCVFVSLFNSCEPDHQIILYQQFEELVINDEVSRIIVIEDKRYVEVHLKSGEILVIKNQVKEYFIDLYVRLLEEEDITNEPALEFDVRPNASDFLAAYGLLFLFFAFATTMLIITVKQRITIQRLRSRVDELEHELKYIK